jgi:hypothetical protein
MCKENTRSKCARNIYFNDKTRKIRSLNGGMQVRVGRDRNHYNLGERGRGERGGLKER